MNTITATAWHPGIAIAGNAVSRPVQLLIGAFVVLVTTLFASAASGAAADPKAARAYYTSATQGSADAQAMLGSLYAKGAGVRKSDALAFQWFLRAAEQGHAEAQLRLSEFFAVGTGVRKNHVVAYKWALLAGRNTEDAKILEDATKMLGILAEHMSRPEITDARKRAADWKPNLEVQYTASVAPEPTSSGEAESASSNPPPDREVAAPAQPSQGVRADSPHRSTTGSSVETRSRSNRSGGRGKWMQMARRWGF